MKYTFKNKPSNYNQCKEIEYLIPSTAKKAHIVIRNNNGSILKKITITNVGKGKTNLNTNEFPLGIYTYSLWINDKQKESKRLIFK